jgi:hypothetical protein
MGARVNHANHLGATLTFATARNHPTRPGATPSTISPAEKQVFCDRIEMKPTTSPTDPSDLSDPTASARTKANCAPAFAEG